MHPHAFRRRQPSPRTTTDARTRRDTLTLALLLATLVPACAPAERLGAPIARADVVAHDTTSGDATDDGADDSGADGSGAPTGIARQRLEEASAGLTYTSESDRPFAWYFRAGPVADPLAVDGIRAALGVAPTVRVEERDLDDFFARHIEWVDPYDSAAMALVPRYEQLRATVREVLRDPRVFRVGRIEIDCYIVGFDRAGNLVGLTTVAIET